MTKKNEDLAGKIEFMLEQGFTIRLDDCGDYYSAYATKKGGERLGVTRGTVSELLEGLVDLYAKRDYE